MKKTHAAITGGGSAWSRYRRVVVGRDSIIYFLYYEWCMMLSGMPGAAGLFLRKIYWPRLFESCGRGCAFASHITLRHPNRIHLGDRVVISEGCILDARHDSNPCSVILEDDIILSNNVMISCKNGDIQIGKHTGINAQTIIQSTNQCPVRIGRDVIIGPRCYIVGGGNYHTDRLDVPIRLQGIRPDGGVQIESDVWLGANVTVHGGVTLGAGSIAASGSVITRSVPGGSVCMGVPSRVVRNRADSA
jgi:galactoside O-acetyltransferase